MTSDRLDQGWVLVLPGIEGTSVLNRGVVKGLIAAGIPFGMEIYDWTHGPLRFRRNLRDRRHHAAQAQVIADRIAQYRVSHPARPVWIIGHSAGGAMTLFALEQLPAEVKVTAGILLLAAISPGYDTGPALRQTTRGLWSVSSWGDLLVLGLGTLACGTCDGDHSMAAGCCGFRPFRRGTEISREPQLTEIPYEWRMLRDSNLGGHFGAVNPRFVKNWIAPLLLPCDPERRASSGAR